MFPVSHTYSSNLNFEAIRLVQTDQYSMRARWCWKLNVFSKQRKGNLLHPPLRISEVKGTIHIAKPSLCFSTQLYLWLPTNPGILEWSGDSVPLSYRLPVSETPFFRDEQFYEIAAGDIRLAANHRIDTISSTLTVD